MASLEDLAAALLGAETQTAIAAENPYLRGAGVADQISGLIPEAYSAAQKSGNSSKNLREAAIASALTGLVGGLFEGAGGDYQQKLTSRYVTGLNQALAKKPVTVEGLPDNLFSRITQSAALFDLQDRIAAGEAQRDVVKAGLLETAKKTGELAAYDDKAGGTGSSLLNP